tara:strand:+ start:16662 stop:18704 length:2043 start_codon:yes stop_codon:yes gene_type:complete
MKQKKIVAIIQARNGSSRFPKKILKKIGKLTLIEILLKRISLSKRINKVVVATTRSSSDNSLIKILMKRKIDFYRGDENNVLNRYYEAAKKFNADIVVRITGDCPVIDPKIVDEVIDLYLASKAAFASNIEPPTYPDGLDVEVFSFNELSNAKKFAKSKFDKEHVTPFIKYRRNIKKINKFSNLNLSKIRLTVDEEVDLQQLKILFKKFKNITKFGIKDIIELYRKDKNIFSLNSHLNRNEGGSLNKGQKLWKRALNIIPDGNMLVSKRPDFYLPKLWPVYFSKAKGIAVWDLENNKYFDLSLMGIGTNILGYANKKINTKINSVLKKSNMSTLNCPEEVKLAESLIELHPWFDMVKFAKTGGEANAIAIRIARAKTGRDKIAVCGYHGWHDWYLSANINDKKNLDTHLLKGLSTNGIPKNLKNTVFPFEYNNFKELVKICKKHKIGAIKMEVFRNISPKNDFLRKVRNLANKNKIILIFDECTSGFRETFGGLHKKYKIIPDMCILGKALGNGYPITAVLGKKEVMKYATTTFISSTFWTDRVGFVAALETLDLMKKNQSWKKICKIGNFIKKEWYKIAKKNKININISGLAACPSFTINSKDWVKYKTFITQYMLENKFLASNTIYVSTAHNDKKIINKYLSLLNLIFKKIRLCEKNIENIDALLKTDVCQTNFKRLN